MLDGIKLEDHPLRSGPATLGVMLGKAPSLSSASASTLAGLYTDTSMSASFTHRAIVCRLCRFT